MLLIKKPNQWDVSLPNGKLLAGTYLFVDGPIDLFTHQQVIDYNVQEITDSGLIADLSLLDYDVWDGEVRRMTTGPNPLSDPLTGSDLAAHLRGAKYLAKRNASIAYAAKYQALATKEGTLEQASWSQQLTEAQALSADSNVDTPLLDVLATARGVSTSQYATSVIAAAAAYTQSRNDLLTELKSIYQEIDQTTSAVELKNTGWY